MCRVWARLPEIKRLRFPAVDPVELDENAGLPLPVAVVGLQGAVPLEQLLPSPPHHAQSQHIAGQSQKQSQSIIAIEGVESVSRKELFHPPLSLERVIVSSFFAVISQLGFAITGHSQTWLDFTVLATAAGLNQPTSASES